MSKITVNIKLNPVEEALISKNCHDKIIIQIWFKKDKNDVNFWIKENRYIEQSYSKISFNNTEKNSFSYIKIDSDCPWSLGWKHYALLKLDNVHNDTESLDIFLQTNAEALKDLKMKIEELYDDNVTQEWYTLYANEECILNDRIYIGTFARVSNGWKFYPKMQKLP